MIKVKEKTKKGKNSNPRETGTPLTPHRESEQQHLLAVDDPEFYLNREMSWLAFNERVLAEAENPHVPLLERLKFITIFCSNLDEFFMVRLSGLLRLAARNEPSVQQQNDSNETFDEVSLKIRILVKRVEKCMHSEVLPALREFQISFARCDDLGRTDEERLADHFEQQVFPVLTPLAVDPAHPFPYLANLSLYIAVVFEPANEDSPPPLALIEIPNRVTRLIPLPGKGHKHRFFLLENLIKMHLSSLFPWTQISGSYCFRVTRNLDYQLLDSEVKDLMKSIEYELKDREQKVAVRLEYEQGMPLWLCQKLADVLELDASDLYEIEGIFNQRDLLPIYRIEKLPPELKDKPFNPRLSPRLVDERKDVFEIIREKDVFFHHPYDSFASVLDFLRSAAKDKGVLAIKQTLYRSGGDSPIIEALLNAAEQGKQVTVVVELKARFEEANNIEWAKRLERAGAHVVFGFIELKTHCKCTLVIRKEKNGALQKYAHISTGNYNSATARSYTDIGHLTAEPVLCDDIAKLFNFLTGFSIPREEKSSRFRAPEFDKIKVAPLRLREQLIQMIEQEKSFHSKEKPSHIILKMNSLVDLKLCQALYRASQKGVKIDLIVRGVCVLRPGIRGLSETITVVSIVDRFLEHSRIYWFKNGGQPVVYCGSADFMPRNMDRRVEIVWPIEDSSLRQELKEILDAFLRDNCKSHVMQADGCYIRKQCGSEQVFRCQEYFIEKARLYGVKSIAYDQAIKPLLEQSERELFPERLMPKLVVREKKRNKHNKEKKK